MKKIIWIIISCAFVISLTIPMFSIIIIAESGNVLEALEMIEVPDEVKNSLVEDLDLRALEFNGIDDFQKNTIITFDVSLDERIAVGLNNYTILICDSNMNIETALCFNKNATSECYYLGWEGDVLYLLMNRSSLIYYITAEGEVVDIKQYNVMNADNTEHLREITDRESTVVNGTKYGIEKTTWTMKYLGGDKYDLLFRETDNGEREALFSSRTKSPTGNIVLVLVFFIAIVSFAITIAIAFIVYHKIMKKVQHRKS